MTTSVAYLDASAAAKLVVAEPETAALAAALEQVPSWVSSELLEIELRCLVRRLGAPELADRVAGLLDRCHRVRFTRPIRRRACGRFDPAQRALDAIHLATALDLDERGLLLLSYDKRQLAAAEAEGLACASPA